MFSFIVVLMVAGCNTGPNYSAVKGRVTVDGKPIESGLVEFEPVDRNSQSPKGGVITNGDYSAEVPPGEMKVKITAMRSTGVKKKRYDTPDSPVDEITEQFLPKKFNEETELKATIKSGKNDLDFLLKSK